MVSLKKPLWRYGAGFSQARFKIIIIIIIIIITDNEAYSKKLTSYEQVKTVDKVSVA